MNKLNPQILAIEELRRRAKDNKAKNAADFSFLSETYFDKTRNALFLICFSILAYISAADISVSNEQLTTLLISLIAGAVSYFFSYKHSLSLAHYYSELELNLSSAFPTQDEYEDMLRNEIDIHQKHINRHRDQTLSVILLATQAFLLFGFLLCNRFAINIV